MDFQPDRIDENIEKKILELLRDNLMSVSQVAVELGVRKDVASTYLETLRKQGKLRLFVVGKSKVYTLPSFLSTPVRKGRIIGIVSGKGGVGKTTVAINLAAAMVEFEKKAIVIDTDVRMSSLGLQLKLHYFPVTLNDVLKDRISLMDALYIHPSGIRVIPASLTIEDVETEKLKKVLLSSPIEDHILLLDAPPGLESNTLDVLKTCEEVVVVTTPEIPAIADVIKTMDVARALGALPLGIIVNKYMKNERDQLTLKEIEKACELPILGVIPESKLVRKSIFKGMPVVSLYPHSKVSIAFKRTAAKILGWKWEPRIPWWRKLLVGLR